MKKLLYILIGAATLLSSCAKSDINTIDPQIPTEEGKVNLALDLKIEGASVQTVASRAAETFAGQSKENVTDIRGYAFVFAEDPSAETLYSDESELLQKVAFKTIEIDGVSKVYITLTEQTEGCFIRLMTCMTDEVYQEMNKLVSQQMIDEGTATGPVTTFADYKNISVGLKGYYADSENPDPNQLTANLAFPLASPGMSMHDGISQAEIDKVNKVIYMVPVASKIDVTASAASNFTLQEITLLNGAKRARMRSTVLADDGVTFLDNLPLPINLGGVTQYQALSVAAGSSTSAATPIYFYPNNGDGPFDSPLDPTQEDATNLSDPIQAKNPTYLIIKGKAAGFNVEGYYKIPIRYKLTTVGADGSHTTATDDTYNIIRNNHYKVNLISVRNAGYSTFQEAVDGIANDVVYDITIDDPASDDRDELIVSNNGTHYMELRGSEVYIKARSGAEGVDCNLEFNFVSADNVPEFQANMPKVHFSSDNSNIVLAATELSAVYGAKTSYTLNFNVKSAGANKATKGNITVRWGDLCAEIPVSYENKHAYSVNNPNASINGTAVFADAGAIEGTVNDVNGSHTDEASISSFISNGAVVANTTYNGRNFDGYVYPTDRSEGIRRVYCAQASNFELIDKTKGANSEALWSTDGSAVQSIVYRSTGVIYSITDGAANTEGTRSYEVRGDINSVYEGGFSNFNQSSTWGNSKEFSFSATKIGSNQSGTYKPEKSHLANTATLTLTNFADEKKVYKFQVDQFALPYIEDGWDKYDSTNEIYYWYCENVADCSYYSDNVGDELGYSPWVYNAHYIAAEQDQGGTWEWQEAPTENGYRGLAQGLNITSDGISVDKQNPETNKWRFFGKTNDRNYWWESDYQRPSQAYFDLKLTNTTDEMVRLRIRFRRDDGRDW